MLRERYYPLFGIEGSFGQKWDDYRHKLAKLDDEYSKRLGSVPKDEVTAAEKALIEAMGRYQEMLRPIKDEYTAKRTELTKIYKESIPEIDEKTQVWCEVQEDVEDIIYNGDRYCIESVRYRWTSNKPKRWASSTTSVDFSCPCDEWIDDGIFHLSKLKFFDSTGQLGSCDSFVNLDLC